MLRYEWLHTTSIKLDARTILKCNKILKIVLLLDQTNTTNNWLTMNQRNKNSNFTIKQTQAFVGVRKQFWTYTTSNLKYVTFILYVMLSDHAQNIRCQRLNFVCFNVLFYLEKKRAVQLLWFHWDNVHK